jgi:hypothetical protein
MRLGWVVLLVSGLVWSQVRAEEVATRVPSSAAQLIETRDSTALELKPIGGGERSASRWIVIPTSAIPEAPYVGPTRRFLWGLPGVGWVAGFGSARSPFCVVEYPWNAEIGAGGNMSRVPVDPMSECAPCFAWPRGWPSSESPGVIFIISDEAGDLSAPYTWTRVSALYR